MTPTFRFKTSEAHVPHDMLRRLSMAVAVVAVLQLSASTASAQFVISQAAGTDYIAFEAEDFATITNADHATGLQIVHTADGICPPRFDAEPFCIDNVDPPPSGINAGVIELDSGSFVLAPLADSDNPPSDRNGGAAVFDANGGNDQDFVNYQLKFAEEGEYVVYMHYTMYDQNGDGAYGNEDSVFFSREFGNSPQGPRGDNNYWASNPTTPGIPAGADSPATEGNFHWWRADKRGDDPDGVGIYVVDGSNVNTELDWGVAARERHTTVDKYVFSTNPDLTIEELDSYATFVARPDVDLVGDFNLDGTLDVVDFNIIAGNFNKKFSIDDFENYFNGDLNGDLVVNMSDFLQFRGIFSEAGVAGAAIPEPGAGVLMGIATALMLIWRRRRH